MIFSFYFVYLQGQTELCHNPGEEYTLGRSIGGLNCDIGGFRDTKVRSIFPKNFSAVFGRKFNFYLLRAPMPQEAQAALFWSHPLFETLGK